MAVTSTQSKVPADTTNRAIGSYLSTDTAAAFKITTGFKPRYVKVVNEDGDCFMEWFEGMAAAEAMKLIGDIDPVTFAKITSNGITVADDGFTVGLDTDVNVQSQQLSWIAEG